MAVIGPLAATFTDVLVANDLAFTNLNEIRGVADSVFTYIPSNAIFKDSFISLYYLGSAIGSNKATNTEFNVDPFPDVYPPTYWSYDGDSTYWGVVLTPTILNHSSFYVAFEWTRTSDSFVTDRIYVAEFSPNVPVGATNISLNVEFRVGPNNGGDLYPGVDNVRITITYTPPPTAAVTGTATASITEADIVAGGKTVIITLTNDTWVAAGATFNAQRQAIINGIDSAQAEATGWDAVVKALQGVAGVVRTSDTVVTITLDAQATYDITATETITVTVPSAALTGNGGAVVATPTFAIDFVPAPSGPHLGTMGLLGVGK